MASSLNTVAMIVQLKKELNLPSSVVIEFRHVRKVTLLGDVQKISNDRYRIWLADNMTQREYLETLSHEMVHVAQMYRGDLKCNKKSYVWQGIRYTREEMKTWVYFDLPWEYEAENFALKWAKANKGIFNV